MAAFFDAPSYRQKSPQRCLLAQQLLTRGAMHQRRRRLRVVGEHGWEFQSPRNFGAKAGGDLARRDACQIVVFAASGKEKGGTDQYQSVMDVGVESALAV